MTNPSCYASKALGNEGPYRRRGAQRRSARDSDISDRKSRCILARDARCRPLLNLLGVHEKTGKSVVLELIGRSIFCVTSKEYGVEMQHMVLVLLLCRFVCFGLRHPHHDKDVASAARFLAPCPVLVHPTRCLRHHEPLPSLSRLSAHAASNSDQIRSDPHAN